MKNYSRQREAVVSALRSTKCHPTASWIYERVREELPNISLGTVYRNLSELTKEGRIKKLSFGDGCEHFDGDLYAHSHFYCEQCGNILDIPLDNCEDCGKVERENDVTVNSASYVFSGVCAECRKKN